MKVIFLDIDGVICLQKQFGSRLNNKGKKQKRKADLFDKKAIKVLNQIIQESNAKVVLSSTWRTIFSIDEMNQLFSERGVEAEIIDFTVNYEDNPEQHGNYRDYTINTPRRVIVMEDFWADIRTQEINKWLEDHPEVTHWVAIDDLPLMVKNFVITPHITEGIKQCGVKESILSFLM